MAEILSRTSLVLSNDLPVVQRIAAYGTIGKSLGVVENLRKARQTSPELSQRTHALRQWQSQRFRQCYADILQDKHMGAAAHFFLSELYSEQEFSQRDAQFARIAGTLERLFPQSVVQTATLLAQLHALSETLDACMAQTWLGAEQLTPVLTFNQPASLDIYQQLWHALLAHAGYARARQEQLEATQELGLQLHRHTQVPGLRLMLKMMRAPATAAGLSDLQRFLERGFDTFGQLGRAGKVPQFLQTVMQREAVWLEQMAT
jgi:hypothetical protein